MNEFAKLLRIVQTWLTNNFVIINFTLSTIYIDLLQILEDRPVKRIKFSN